MRTFIDLNSGNKMVLSKSFERMSHLKTEESVDRNVLTAVDFLLGKERFIARDKP